MLFRSFDCCPDGRRRAGGERGRSINSATSPPFSHCISSASFTPSGQYQPSFPSHLPRINHTSFTQTTTHHLTHTIITAVMVVKTIAPPAAPLRIVLGGDEAGFAYKAAIFQDLEDDPRVSLVTDVGPYSVSDTTAYPHYAVAAARKVRLLPSSLPITPSKLSNLARHPS